MIRIKQLIRNASCKFEITSEFGCYCLYRLVRNSRGEVINRVLVLNTSEFKKAIIKLIEQIEKQKGK
ncbi:hypothetical protein MHD_05565 [Mannheimia granulomatis]|uniref:Uncharacterized protein n=1 Tax=Mannheimia granulomatis TaxID=85402 RepID=A0A011P5P9_9PAST|nr:hypothetical protein AK33_08650 [Mannheimia granulomatis]RGE48566.1 hypothetical protein MHD_05565 [Mannheimia granulomatis]